MIEIVNTERELVEVVAEGKLTHEDYQKVLPELEAVIEEHGTMRCLVELRDIEGMEPEAVAADLKFDFQHRERIDRCALVADEAWQRKVGEVWGQVMPGVELKVFAREDLREAEKWVRNRAGDTV